MLSLLLSDWLSDSNVTLMSAAAAAAAVRLCTQRLKTSCPEGESSDVSHREINQLAAKSVSLVVGTGLKGTSAIVVPVSIPNSQREYLCVCPCQERNPFGCVKCSDRT